MQYLRKHLEAKCDSIQDKEIFGDDSDTYSDLGGHHTRRHIVVMIKGIKEKNIMAEILLTG